MISKNKRFFLPTILFLFPVLIFSGVLMLILLFFSNSDPAWKIKGNTNINAGTNCVGNEEYKILHKGKLVNSNWEITDWNELPSEKFNLGTIENVNNIKLSWDLAETNINGEYHIVLQCVTGEKINTLNINFNIHSYNVKGRPSITTNPNTAGSYQYKCYYNNVNFSKVNWKIEEYDGLNSSNISIDKNGNLKWNNQISAEKFYHVKISCSKTTSAYYSFNVNFVVGVSYFIDENDNLIDIPYSDKDNVLTAFCFSADVGVRIVSYGGEQYENIKGVRFGDDWNELEGVGNYFCSCLFLGSPWNELIVVRLPYNLHNVGECFCQYMLSGLSDDPSNLISLPFDFYLPQNITSAGNLFCWGIFCGLKITSLPYGFTIPQNIETCGEYSFVGFFLLCSELDYQKAVESNTFLSIKNYSFTDAYLQMFENTDYINRPGIDSTGSPQFSGDTFDIPMIFDSPENYILHNI